MRLFPDNPESGRLTVVCARGEYSASYIARAVEDAEANLLNLNVTSDVRGDGAVTVDLRFSHRNTGAVARSLLRYGYHVTEADGDAHTETSDSNSLQGPLAVLERYLNI